jgi:hypothetical protein
VEVSIFQNDRKLEKGKSDEGRTDWSENTFNSRCLARNKYVTGYVRS